MSSETLSCAELSNKYPIPEIKDSQREWNDMLSYWRVSGMLEEGKHFWYGKRNGSKLTRCYSERRVIRLIYHAAMKESLRFHIRCVMLLEEHRATMLEAFSSTSPTPTSPSASS